MIASLSFIPLIHHSIFVIILWPSLVASFEACPTSNVFPTSRQSGNPFPPCIWTLSAQSDDDEWVLNPETNRRIKRNGPKWHDIMNQQGGYICHDSKLVPIQLELLWVWTQEASDTSQKTQSTVDDSIAKVQPNTTWRRLGPQILSSDELPNYVEEESLPFLDELLFAQKPPSLLTLPGIGEDKQICLASLVNDWIPENLTVPRTKLQSSNGKKNKKKRKKQHLKPFVPRPCHRLDYDTSGVLVIGLTRDSLRLTNAMFEQKGAESGSSSNILKKTYVALVAGDIAKDHGMIDYP